MLKTSPPKTELQRYLRENGIKPIDLARETGLNFGTIHQIVCGRTKSPRYKNVLTISSALGVKPEILFPEALKV